MKNILHFLTPIVILAIAVSGFMALKMGREESPLIHSDEVVWRVDAMVATPAENRPQLTLYGITEAETFSEIKSTLAAEVINILSHEGDQVEKGTPLVELDSRESALLVLQRQAEINEINSQIELEEIKYHANVDTLQREQQLLQLSRGELQRIRKLKKGSMVSDSAADQALQEVERQLIKVAGRQQQIDEYKPRKRRLQAQRERLQALLSQTRLDLERATLFAPYSAVVHKIPVAPGGLVRPGDLVVSLYDPGSIQIRAQIPRTSIQQVRHGLEDGKDISMEGVVDGIPLQAKLVRLVSNQIDEVGGIEGIFTVTRAAMPPLPGRALQLSVTLPAIAGTIVIPYEALYENSRVYLIDEDGRLDPVTVSTLGWGSAADKSLIVVRSPELKAGDRVVTTHLPEAMKGLKVNHQQSGIRDEKNE